MSDSNILPRLARRFADGFVLAFHDLVPERFQELVDCLGAFEPVHLSDLLARARDGKSTAGLFAITVDDGVGVTVRSLAKVLEARAWPATFYLPTAYLDTGSAMPFQWWRTLLPLPREVIELRSGALDLSAPGAAERLARKMELLWHTARPERYVPLIMELVERLSARNGAPRCPPPPVSWTEVAEISRRGLLRFESHGVSHTAMSALSEEEIAREMKSSRDLISDWTGRPCRHLAYPFGNPRSIGTLAPLVARRFYDSAATLSLGGIEQQDPWLLPRIPLYPENSNTVARLKVLLKGNRRGWVNRAA
jgi:peptidoglycan/xylan/chitin deacetylase (PgdA/CDA1 family)